MLQDLLFSSRELRKKPGLVLTAIISLTLGIGATVGCMFTSILVKPVSLPRRGSHGPPECPQRAGDNRGVGVTGASIKVLRQANCIESLAASWGTWNLTTTDEDLPQDVPSVQLSAMPAFISACRRSWAGP